MMANDGLTALDVATGTERWVKELGGPVPANAPFVVRDHVYVTVGSDAGVARSWIESRNARTGEREWIWYTIPKEGEFGFNTWPTEEEAGRGQGTPWQAPAYDPEQNLLIFGTGNPDPIKDGRSSARRQSVYGLHRRAGRGHGQARLVLPGHAAR